MPGPGGPGGPGGPKGGFQRPKNTKNTLFRLLGYLKKDTHLLFLVVFLILISTGSQLAGTLLLSPIIDTAAGVMPGGLAKVGFYLVILAAVYLAGVAATFIQNRLMIRISQNTVYAMRRDLYDRMMTLPLRFFDTRTHGEIMSHYSNDMDIVSETLNNSVVQVLASVISLIGTLISMIVISPILTLITVILVPLMIILARFIMKYSRRQFSQQQQALGELNGCIEETIEGQRVVKIFCYEDHVENSFQAINTTYRQKATLAQIIAGIMMPIMQHINTLCYVLTATVGGMLALQGYISVGNIASFLNLTRQFGRPVTEISNQMNMIQSALAGAERVFHVIDQLSEPERRNPLLSPVLEDVRLEKAEQGYVWQLPDGKSRSIKGDVCIEDVTFGYTPDKVVLRHVSLHAKPGQKIAFVGSTGAGKTTITNLLTRFYEIDQGSILVDGLDIRRIPLSDLRRSLAIVLQDTHLFSGTVMENIRYGRPEATDEECIEAAKLASAHSFIQKLPQRYDTPLEGDGSNLSQGQRQLLNIARAAVADPAILILDEATSSVDTRTERHIEKGMDRLMEGRTTFIIAHRLSTVRNADAIMVIEQGEILERGNHEELIKQKGRYYQLYTGQFELD